LQRGKDCCEGFGKKHNNILWVRPARRYALAGGHSCLTNILFCSMSVLALIIACSFVVAAGFLAAFLWAVKSGQYEDKYTPSVRILLDEEKNNNHKGTKPQNQDHHEITKSRNHQIKKS
jgi:cbb3-type cytochrome oxidase maturation protein